MKRRLNTQQTGFTLLEALVAIVIISIGLLGLISLQTASLQNTQVSANSSQATIAAESMASRMRANKVGVKAGDYDGLDTANAPGNAPNCTNNVCSAKKVAKYDQYHWKQSLDASLPNARGSIKRTGGKGKTPPYKFRITISWRPHHAKGYQNAASKNSNPATRCSNAHQHCLTQRVTL